MKNIFALARNRGSAQMMKPSSALAAPLPHIRFYPFADIAGRDVEGRSKDAHGENLHREEFKSGQTLKDGAMKDENDKTTKEMLTDIVGAITGNTYSLKGQAMQAIQFIDEVKDSPIDTADMLTDEQLGRGGLVKIEAFMRTKTSAAASRKAKQREHQKAEGIHTVTLTVPAAAKEQLKAVAAEIVSGKSLVEAVQSVTSHGQVTSSIWDGKKIFNISSPSREQIIGERVLALTGWRLMIAKAIGIL